MFIAVSPFGVRNYCYKLADIDPELSPHCCDSSEKDLTAGSLSVTDEKERLPMYLASFK
jgi:hypothetical protein